MYAHHAGFRFKILGLRAVKVFFCLPLIVVRGLKRQEKNFGENQHRVGFLIRLISKI